MTGLEQAAVVVVAGWLVVLTTVVVLLVRQVGLMTVRLTFAAPNVSADDVGLPVGELVPSDIAQIADGNGGSASNSNATLLFFSGTCAQCRTIAQELTAAEVRDDMVFLIAGEPSKAQGIADLLPKSAKTIVGAGVHPISQALRIDSVPFGVRIGDGAIAAKAYLQVPADISTLIGRSDRSRTKGPLARVLSLNGSGSQQRESDSSHAQEVERK